MRVLRLLVVPLAALGMGCGHVAVLKPAPEGKLQFEAALGGPMVIVGGQPIPVPLSTAGVRYGVGPKWDLAAHAHLTPIAFGVGGLDVGGSAEVLTQEKGVPTVTLSSRLYGFGALRGGALGLIDATAAMSWATAEETLRVFLAPTLLQPFAASPVTFSVGAGAALRIKDTEVQLEARWYQPTVNSSFAAANWVAVGEQGAFGIVLGLRQLLQEAQ